MPPVAAARLQCRVTGTSASTAFPRRRPGPRSGSCCRRRRSAPARSAPSRAAPCRSPAACPTGHSPLAVTVVRFQRTIFPVPGGRGGGLGQVTSIDTLNRECAAARTIRPRPDRCRRARADEPPVPGRRTATAGRRTAARRAACTGDTAAARARPVALPPDPATPWSLGGARTAPGRAPSPAPPAAPPGRFRASRIHRPPPAQARRGDCPAATRTPARDPHVPASNTDIELRSIRSCA